MKTDYRIEIDILIVDGDYIEEEFKGDDEFEKINYLKVNEYQAKCVDDLEKFCNDNKIEFKYHFQAWESITSMDEYCEELSVTLTTDMEYKTLKEKLTKLRRDIDYCKSIILYDENKYWEEIK